MTRIQIWIASIAAGVAFILTFLGVKERKDRKDERGRIAAKNTEANNEAFKEIGDAIRHNDTAADARKRLRERNARNK